MGVGYGELAFIVDSGAHIPKAFEADCEAIGIPIIGVPFFITIGDDNYRDETSTKLKAGVGVEEGKLEIIASEEFYARMASLPITTEDLPTTAQPNQADFILAYEKALSLGAKKAIVVTIIGSLSKTLDRAQEAMANVQNLDIRVVDSQSGSGGQFFPLYAGKLAVEKGLEFPKVYQEIMSAVNRVHTFLFADNPKYLESRIGWIKATAASLLKLRPVIQVVNGEVAELAKSRTRSQAINAMVSGLENRVGQTPVSVYAVYTDTKEVADQTAAQVIERLNVQPNPYMSDGINIVPVARGIGRHVGLRAAGLIGYTNS